MATLYSAWYCPFAQRAWIGLAHKKVSFDYVETDPYEKTVDWMRVSRGTGQVPVLQSKALYRRPSRHWHCWKGHISRHAPRKALPFLIGPQNFLQLDANRSPDREKGQKMLDT
jgi:hypothetical protein